MMRGICGRTRSELFDAAGWYATGDLGSLDRDGYLWYAGRRDDMFKVKGATVYPSERHREWCAVVAALVVAKDPPAAVADVARTRLSAFKIPTLWHVVANPDAVPMSATGKVDKTALQRLLQEHGVRCTRSS